jgi:hypothetical protein
MKKFSLKALGATLLAAGLVVAGVSAPAYAVAGVTMVTSPAPTFTASSASTAFKITVDNGGTAFVSDASPSATQLVVDVRGTGGVTGMWSPKSGCATSFTAATFAGCGILSITGTGIGSPEVKNDFGQLAIKGLGTATSVTIDFDSAAFQTAADGGTYNLKAQTGPVWNPTSYTLALTVAAAAPPQQATVTFNANGGTGSMSNQSFSFATTLSPIGFTKAGTTFSGWSTTCNGNVVYANRGLYSFSTSVTLYAKWADGSNACGGGGGSSATANLTINATTGQLVAGSTVAVAASGLQATVPYTVVVQSTPQTIGSGNATAGAVNTSVTLPSGLEAGWHSLTFTSTGSSGSALTSVTYFKVSASGTLLATASTIPAELASTGFDGLPYLATGGMLALAGVTIMLFARRRYGN